MKKVLVCGMGGGYGGVSNVIMTVLRNVDKSEIIFTVAETYDSVYHDEILDLGFDIVKLPIFKKYFKYKKAVKQLFEQQLFDAVWINNTSKVDLVIMKYAARHGVKIITHSHGSVQEGGRIKRIIFEVLNKLHERKFYKFMDCGIACSQSSADYFYNEKFLNGKKVYVLTNAIDCDKYIFSESKRAEARKLFDVDRDDIVLACIGRVCEVKNLGFVLKIMKRLPAEYKLMIIGGGDIDSLQNQVRDLGLESKVIIVGERSDIADLINGVDILLLPSLSEGLPMVVLEAQANGIKCFVSKNVSDECKVLESTEFLPIDNETVWADAIKKSNFARNENANKIIKEKGYDISSYVRVFTEIVNNV